ncbi:hypothetical protein K504DRAFT_504558 [Pleomassaria siparia CBS 279.74]|uniref:Rhodopsin domain-containing protein n=1 Tax=Pleomassaria siparia CBS 279.74 TaxID=1314801 RepID=A0A6G1K3K5_9PLEO|nr:hypothetical protein K504DRAFT_504558 [Pleomassaria siparia CBS 279.74]
MSTTQQHSPEWLAHDLGPTVIATASLTIICSTLFVGLRYYARYLAQTKLSIEDVLIPFAWLAEIGLCITGIFMVQIAGTGHHQDYVIQMDPEMLVVHYKGIMVIELVHPSAVAFSKLAVLLLYLKVFTGKTTRLITWIVIYIVIGTWVSFTIAIVFQCRPFAFNWDKTIPSGVCFNIMAFSKSGSVPNIISDVVVLILPIRTVVELKISRARKVGLLLIFLLGSVGIVASIVRTVVFCRINFADATYNTDAINWTIIEPGLYLEAACAMSFKPLFRMVAKVLHLNSFITQTRSFVFSQNAIKGSNRTAASIEDKLYMDTLKSSNSSVFTKLHSGATSSDEEAEVGLKSDGDQVVMSRSWIDDEDEEEEAPDANVQKGREERYNAACDNVEVNHDRRTL